MQSSLGVRWTIGNVSPYGFEALRLSVWGAWRLFGPQAGYTVCLNSVDLEHARRLTGELPPDIVWRDVTGELDPLVARYLDAGLAEGVGWKFAPLQLYPERYELALDNDCILWRMPDALRHWLDEPSNRCVIAADVRRCLGQFAHLCGPEPRNSAIRGLPPGFDLRRAIGELLDEHPCTLSSELDEQGLQVAIVSRYSEPLVVTTQEVSICSPFPPHAGQLGTCGAHFVGLNAHRLPWDYDGAGASEHVRAHFVGWRNELYARVGLKPATADDVRLASAELLS